MPSSTILAPKQKRSFMGIITSHSRKYELHVTFPTASNLTLNVPVRYLVTSQYIFKVLFQTLNCTYHCCDLLASCSLPYRTIWVTWRLCCEMSVEVLSIYSVLPSTVLWASLPHGPSWQFLDFSALVTLHVLYMHMLSCLFRCFKFWVQIVNNNVFVCVCVCVCVCV